MCTEWTQISDKFNSFTMNLIESSRILNLIN